MEDAHAKILVVDDEERIRRLIRMYLERENFMIEEASNGREALFLALNNDYDAILLDIMIPELDGIEVCEDLRKEKMTPVIMLTAKGEESNGVHVFEVGADDYIVKPFSTREVVLRVIAMLRRVADNSYDQTDASAKHIIVFPQLTIDLNAYRVTASGKEVYLTLKEYEPLCFPPESPDKVFK